MTKDPVCGKSADEKTTTTTSTYEGRKYAFCSQECKDKFDHAPEQYPAQAEQPMTRQQGAQGQQKQKAAR